MLLEFKRLFWGLGQKGEKKIPYVSCKGVGFAVDALWRHVGHCSQKSITLQQRSVFDQISRPYTGFVYMTLWGCKEMPPRVAVIAVHASQYPKQPKNSLFQGACLTTARVLSTKALMPKSAILTCPLEFSRMFAGLMSRCTWQSQQKQVSEGEWVGWKTTLSVNKSNVRHSWSWK